MAPAPIVPIGVMLGQANSAFKLVGGSSIIFNALRSRIFGKVLRTVEYPDGELHSIKIYNMNMYKLRSLIAETQPPPFPTAFLEPDHIKQISIFTSPHFTEKVLTDADVSALPDNAWLFWSKDSYNETPIPTRGVKLDGSHVKKKSKSVEVISSDDRVLQDEAIGMATKLRKNQQFSRWQYDRIIDMAIDRDSALLAISRNFGTQQDEFRIHCVRLLQRRDPRTILMGDAGSEKDPLSESEDEPEEDSKRRLEPQPELSSRE